MSETETPASMRHSYTIALEIKPISPLTHGAGSEGNEQILHTREVVVHDYDEGWLRERVPCVSGSAMKATLREWAVKDALERAGVQDGGVSKDALRLLTKGGKNDKGGQTVSVGEARRLRDLFPLLSVFGSMDGGLPIRGKIQVSEVMPLCDVAVDAGIVPRQISRMQVSDDKLLVEGEQIPIWPNTDPIPVHLTRTTVQYYRHDMLSGPHTHLLPSALVDGQAQAQADRKAKGRAAKKAERREANESMPHAMQAIAPGVPMVATLRLHDATEAELGCVLTAIARWITAGATLGGATTKGHGRCEVRVAGALRYRPESGDLAAAPGTVIEVSGRGEAEAFGRAYASHVAANAEEIRQYVAKATR